MQSSSQSTRSRSVHCQTNVFILAQSLPLTARWVFSRTLIGYGQYMSNATENSVPFHAVDSSSDPENLLAFLDRIESLPPMAAIRTATYEALPKGRGIDVGCGHGRAVAELTDRGLDVTGVDPSNTFITAARRRFPSCDFLIGEAADLSFEDASLNWYRAERVYLHIADPLPSLTEARRVLAPGGRIVLADQDFETGVLASAHPALARTALNAFTDSMHNGRAGTLNPGLLAQAGFTDIQVSAHPLVFTDLADVLPLLVQPALTIALGAGLLSQDEADTLFNELQERARSDSFLISNTLFITTATRPA